MPRPLPRQQRGYDADYDRTRRNTPKPNGDPCPFPYCGHAPMFSDQALDFDHGVALALGGDHTSGRWAHRKCNRRHGALLGNKLRAVKRKRVRSRDW